MSLIAGGAGTKGDSMQYRKLGVDGPDISVVGFGAWALGGPWLFGWGPQDDQESMAALYHALDSGVNWVDTAAAYGLGHSEEVVGQVLRERGDETLVFTKCGLNWYGRRDRVPQNDLRPESIRFELEQSLKRLGTNHVDLYQFHWPDMTTGTAIEDSWAVMGELIDQGKVRWGGVSNFGPDLLTRCEHLRHVDAVQPPLSLLDRAAVHDVLPWARTHGTGVIAYSPMASGLLTGAFDAQRVEDLAEDDWRRRSPDFQQPNLARTMALVDTLRVIAERRSTTVPAVAIAWVLSNPTVTGAIVGARRPSQVDGWIPAGDLCLSDAEQGEIRAALASTGAGHD